MDLDAWLEYIAQQHQQTIDMGLSRTEQMVQRLGLTQPAPKVITVAGTNGKGSTVIGIESLLLGAGIRVASTLSPHIQRFNERLRVDGVELEDDVICAAFAEIEAARCIEPVLPLTYFEFSALAALWSAKKHQVGVAILEIGLGGRLDAFNVIDADVAVITSIGLDHQSFLGNTREAIGAEKAGILRSGQQVVLGEDMPSTVIQRCDDLQLKPKRAGVDFKVAIDHGQNTWSLQWDEDDVDQLPIGHLAPNNVALAYQAAMHLVPITSSNLARTAEHGFIAGRLQQVSLQGRLCVHDVGHNPAGAAFLTKQLLQRNLRPKWVLCAMLADKDHLGVYRELSSVFDSSWILVDSQGDRGFSAAQLGVAMGIDCEQAPDMATAFDQAMMASDVGDVILVFGSFNAIEQSPWLELNHDQ